jgi:hypothetical protein
VFVIESQIRAGVCVLQSTGLIHEDEFIVGARIGCRGADTTEYVPVSAGVDPLSEMGKLFLLWRGDISVSGYTGRGRRGRGRFHPSMRWDTTGFAVAFCTNLFQDFGGFAFLSSFPEIQGKAITGGQIPLQTALFDVGVEWSEGMHGEQKKKDRVSWKVFPGKVFHGISSLAR